MFTPLPGGRAPSAPRSEIHEHARHFTGQVARHASVSEPCAQVTLKREYEENMNLRWTLFISTLPLSHRD